LHGQVAPHFKHSQTLHFAPGGVQCARVDKTTSCGQWSRLAGIVSTGETMAGTGQSTRVGVVDREQPMNTAINVKKTGFIFGVKLKRRQRRSQQPFQCRERTRTE